MPRQQQQARPPEVDYVTFGPGTMIMLQQVVEKAWQELVKRGDPVAEAAREQIVREILAHRVMSRATRGVLDPVRLLEEALRGFSH